VQTAAATADAVWRVASPGAPRYRKERKDRLNSDENTCRRNRLYEEFDEE